MPASTGEEIADRGPAIIALFWVESAIAILVLALRFYGRLISSKLGKDDYAMLFTVVREYREKPRTLSPIKTQTTTEMMWKLTDCYSSRHYSLFSADSAHF